MKQNDDTFRICAECDQGPYFEQIEVIGLEDESWDICPACRTVEGKTKYVDESGKEIDA